MDNGIITFDFIFDCWKTNVYPEGFDYLLEGYMKTKIEVFSNANVMQPTAWLNKILIAVEIGMLRDEARFKAYKSYWATLLGREWTVSIEDKWVTWR